MIQLIKNNLCHSWFLLKNVQVNLGLVLHGLSIKLDLFYVYKLYAILEEMKSFNLGLNQFEVTFDHRIGRFHNFVIIRNCWWLVTFAWNVFRREKQFEWPILCDPFSCFLFRVFPRGLFSHVVCVSFLSVFVACVC